MNETILNELFAYAVAIRRKLHEYPEVGFDLKRTEAAVTDELRKMGIQSTDRYGTCSCCCPNRNMRKDCCRQSRYGRSAHRRRERCAVSIKD